MADRITTEQRRRILNSGLFDEPWYQEQYPDVIESGLDPLEHFVYLGSLFGRSGAPEASQSAQEVRKSLEKILRTGGHAQEQGFASTKELSTSLATPQFGRLSKQPSFLDLGEHTAAAMGPALSIKPSAVDELVFEGTLAIHLHLFYRDLLEEMLRWLEAIPVPFDLYVSVASRADQLDVQSAFSDLPCVNRAIIEVFPNRGRDIAPMMTNFAKHLNLYDVVGHLHTKRSDHTPEKRDWSLQLGYSLFQSPGYTAQILNQFAKRPDLGIVFPVYHPSVHGQIKWGANYATAARQISLLTGDETLAENDLLPFPAGSFFLARTEAIRPLLEANLKTEDFDQEEGQVDGTLAHAIERLLTLVADQQGYGFQQVMPTKPHTLARAYLDGQDQYNSDFFSSLRDDHEVSLPMFSHPSLKGLKIRFFTCSTGGYDEPHAWEGFVEGADHLFYSDQNDTEQEAQWQIHPLSLLHENPIKAARRHKAQPHHLFDDVDLAVWIDGNISVTGDITGMLAKVIEQDANFGVIPHPYRASVSEELDLLRQREIDDPDVMQAQVNRYIAEGFPDSGGLTETNFLVMDLRKPVTRHALDLWWSEINKHSRRDQLSFDYACWLAGAKKVPLISNGLSIRADARFAYFSHGTKDHPGRDLRQTLAAIWNKRVPHLEPKLHDRASLSVDVVVCVHNSPDDVARCLRSIALNRDARTRIVIVDDGSEDTTRQVIARHLASNEADILVQHDRARGYTKAANAGMRASDADYVILLNSDTIVPAEWVSRLVEAGEADESVGIVGPLSNAASWQSVPETMMDGDLAVNDLPGTMSVDDLAELVAKMPASPVYPCPVINGFCFAIKRKVIDTIGYLDEETFPQGYGEENDYCLRLRPHRMTCGFTLSTFVFHAKSKSFNHERRRKLSTEGWYALVNKHSKEELAQVVDEMKAHPALARARQWFRSQTARLEPKAQAIGFYLPQFHPIPFNDKAWGAGFTEWRNVVKGKPRYDGHSQPFLPGELGYYDLRTRETLAQQAKLAAEHGFYGMAIYYYRFGSRRLMSAPTDTLLESAGIDLRFFYCWANEDWTRAWDGKTDDVLLKQDYSDDTLKLLVQDVAQACADTRYIRIDDRPVIMIYQLNKLPDAASTLNHIRELFVEQLNVEPILGTTWNPEFRTEWEELVDFIAQFPPHRTPRVSKRMLLPRGSVPGVSDETKDHLESYDHVVEQSLEAMDVYDRLAPGVCPMWDNSPRRARQANILIDSTPEKFGDWVASASQKAAEKHAQGKTPSPLLFVNAWNEWAEGAVMEPSEFLGRAYLQAFARSIL